MQSALDDVVAWSCLAATAIVITFLSFLIWRAGKRIAWRRLAQGSPMCPRCGYDMRGLTEARCPECGSVYTLDSLWSAQRDLTTGFEERIRND